MKSLEKIADKYLLESEKNGLKREIVTTNRQDATRIIRGGREYISFSCNDYLGLTHHPKVKRAAIEAIKKYGAGAGASRLVTGSHPLYDILEQKIAKLKNTEDAIVFGSGYLVNIGIIPALVGKGDLIIADRLVHACLIDGAQLSGAKLMRFEHNNVEKCASILQKYRAEYNNCLIITDNIFSMDGDAAPVDALFILAEQNNAWLLTDDAHGIGVLSDKPRNNPHLQMGTLSKAVGAYGGYVATSKKVADLLRNKSRSLVYSTGLPPSVISSAIEALDVIENDKELCGKPLANARYFTKLLGVADATSPIVPLILGDEHKAIAASQELKEYGFLVSAIRPPTVPKATSRLRFTFSALHKKEDIERLAQIIKEKLL